MAKANQKQRVRQNKKVLRTHLLALSLALTSHVLLLLVLSQQTSYVSFHTTTLLSTFIIELLCYRQMAMLARPRYDATGLVDGGADLSKKNGSHSYYQDVIIITIACHVLTLISRWFWLLWLSIPGFAAFQLYTHIVSPFVLSSKPSSVSQEEEELPVKRRATADGNADISKQQRTSEADRPKPTKGTRK